MPERRDSREILALTTQIVTAHVSHNTVSADELPKLLQQIFETLLGIDRNGQTAIAPKGAVSVSKSITPDYIICLEDGKKLKMLKRHLKTAFNMTPDEYRTRWGLPSDYPMVAPNYAKQRRKLAKAIGLGTRPRRRR
ncbi:MAG: MucR family transcriptional regulator [Nitrospinaceae bacterium]|jgi:predicted transcriptional regulator|nr:MucR family transcriptional regulator [Rhodospirillaceae bacterium]MEE1551628.1 MucR family transcriptional regulator [Nitrospinaceae bacterium]HJO89143.1 MucR family transcriptional regulator [Alphaproteobacteria bacterium]|tara:strand:+ start:1426 stop:1836 length:411 start_codon:yes stop_codon:yes gene_type:complete